MGLALDDHDLWVHDESLTGQQCSTCHITERMAVWAQYIMQRLVFFFVSGTLTPFVVNQKP